MAIACVLTLSVMLPTLAVPPRQSVRLLNASLLDTYMEHNLDYLLNSFTVDHILYNFRLRAGVKAPPLVAASKVGTRT